ncbi:MAG: hypothetical protein K2O97_12815 [Acetatifactor sp.]|nr:hypothetical protein [Acetatifactor sp.]
MGEANVALNVYMSRSDRIRSVLEYYLGEKLPEDWAWEEIKGFYPVNNSKGKLTYRQRDFIGKACVRRTHFLLGLENQDKINLIFPWRLLEMDCLAYGRELETISEENGRNRRFYGKNDDFLYRYGKEDRIKPILNLTLYWGKENWDAPLALREMMEDISRLPLKLQQLAGDYKIHVIHMRRIPEKAFQEMDSDLRYVLGLMKRSGSPKKYKEYIQENKEFFSRIPGNVFDVIDVCTNIKDIRGHLNFEINQESQEEEADMCKALDEIQKNAEQKGIRKEIKQGKKEGIQEGISKMNTLIQRLLADGKQEELAQAAADALFRKKLFAEYHIE